MVLRTRFDQFVKQMLANALASSGNVETDAEASADVQRVDVLFVPTPEREVERRRIGLLGRMAASACLFEAFHRTPGIAAIRECARKQLTVHRALAKGARRRRMRAPVIPVLWVLSSGRPHAAIRGLGMVPMPGWPRGFHQAPEALALRLVVISELPKTRETLLLRLLGRGRTLIEAIMELRALFPSAWEATLAMPLLISLRLTIPDDPRLQSAEDEELAMIDFDEVYERWERGVLAKGLAKGRAEGRAEGRAKGRAEGRARGRAEGLRLALRSIYEARFGVIPPAIRDAIERAGAEELAEWSAPFATASAAKISTLLRPRRRPASPAPRS